MLKHNKFVRKYYAVNLKKYLACHRAENPAVSVCEHDGAVFLVNDHLCAVFCSISVVWFAVAPK
jgi:hypothetical protein